MDCNIVLTPQQSAASTCNVNHVRSFVGKTLPPPTNYPKNLALLSLMELSQHQQNNEGQEDRTAAAVTDIEVEQENETGLATDQMLQLVKDYGCGSYVVVDMDGLVVLSSMPQDENGVLDQSIVLDSDEKIGPNDRNISQKSKTFLSKVLNRSENKTKTTCEAKSSPELNTSGVTLPTLLQYGDKVQVVEVVDSFWFRLSRKRGFIFADPSQLVRVGGPDDRACLLEATILALTQQRQNKTTEESRLNLQSENLYKSLSKVTKVHYPVAVKPLMTAADLAPIPHIEKIASSSKTSTTTKFLSPKRNHIELLEHATPSPNSQNSPGSPLTRSAQHSETTPSSPSLFGIPLGFGFNRTYTHVPPSPSQASNLSSSSAPLTSTQTRDILNLTLNRSNSTKNVNFRTGMSGHLALSTARTNRNGSQRHQSMYRMSDHKGLTNAGSRPTRRHTVDDDELSSWR